MDLNNSSEFKNVSSPDSETALISYDMAVEAFPESHQLSIRAAVGLYSKKVGDAQLIFILQEQFKVEKVTQADKSLQFIRDKEKIIVKGIRLKENSSPLIFHYHGNFKPPFNSDSMANVIIYEDEVRITFTSGWYPEAGWISQLVTKPSSKLSVEVPEGFTVISGDYQKRPACKSGGRIRYEYSSRTHGSLSFIALKCDHLSIPWGQISIEAYYFKKEPQEKPKLIITRIKRGEEDIREILELSRKILDFYSSIFVPYPHSSFSLVQKSNYAAYAYSVQSYVIMNDLSINERTLAHEIAHQWWGNLIHPVGEGERWLTESLAEYSAFLYMNHFHKCKNIVTDSRDFLLSQMENIPPVRKATFDTLNYENIVYKIGPHIFHSLRYVIGEEQFFEVLRNFSEKYAYKNATVDNFIEVAESVYKSSLDWFFDEWLDNTGNPAFVLESQISRGASSTFLVHGEIIQHNTNYRMPLKIEITGENQREEHLIWVQDKKTPFEFQVPFKAEEVKFTEDMSYWILAGFFNSEQERQAAIKNKPELPALRGIEELHKLIREKITQEYKYNTGTEIEFELEAEQAVRLDCAENPYNYKEILICIMEGALCVWTFYTDGTYSGGGTSLTSGFSERGRSMSIRNIAAWEIRDNRVHIKFRTETDKKKIKQIFIKKCEKKGQNPDEIEKLLKQFFS